ncbi:MAG TPA: NAD(P)/FAD-dependent oxidoreductase, partial [Candidatus Sumerlaeota bacterium]|nr:NAD(P)/FAD-dependent oxidoreductase [Candidatus Sumerlaeota bacterium]
MTHDIIIVGAGAAGLAAAIFAAGRADGQRRILLVDGAKKPGAK